MPEGVAWQLEVGGVTAGSSHPQARRSWRSCVCVVGSPHWKTPAALVAALALTTGLPWVTYSTECRAWEQSLEHAQAVNASATTSHPRLHLGKIYANSNLDSSCHTCGQCCITGARQEHTVAVWAEELRALALERRCQAW